MVLFIIKKIKNKSIQTYKISRIYGVVSFFIYSNLKNIKIFPKKL